MKEHMLRIVTPSLVLFMVGTVLLTGVPTTKADEETKSLYEKFRYPNREKGDSGIEGGNYDMTRMTTKDDFDKVVQHYEKVIGGQLSIEKGSGAVVGGGRYVIDHSVEGSAEIRIFIHHADKYIVTIIVTRAKEEKLTQISVVTRVPNK